MKEKTIKYNKTDCRQARLALQDTLFVLGGKWKLVLISILLNGKMKFNELSREAGISPRILSKELQELQSNGLITRKVCNTKPVTVEYQLTPYSKTLWDVITAMHKWGVSHRNRIIKGAR